VHAGAQVKFQNSTGRIDANCVVMHPLDWHFCTSIVLSCLDFFGWTTSLNAEGLAASEDTMVELLISGGH